MTYGEKYKEVFGYYPEEIPCPDECPKEYENRFCEVVNTLIYQQIPHSVK